MKRRHFVFATLAALAGGAAWRLTGGTDEDAIVEVVRKKLDYLSLDEAGIRAFARDLAQRHIVSSVRLKVLMAASPLYTHLTLTGDNFLTNAIRPREERITTLYLLSSDFFVNQADQSRVVQYLGYYDPLRACANPFARLTTG